MFGFKSLVHIATYLKPQSIYCVKRLMAVKLDEMVISLSSKAAAIWHG